MKKQLRAFLTFLILWPALVSQAQDWPSYSGVTHQRTGPLGRDIAIPSNYHQLLWRNNVAIGPGRSQAKRYGCNYGKVPGGGSASVINYDNLLYLNVWEPAGSIYDTSIVNDLVRDHGCDTTIMDKNLWKISGLDVIYAIDKHTGATVWRRDIPGIYNNNHSKPRGRNGTMLAADGKVFVFTSLGEVYALNAKTGATVWQSNVGSLHTNQVALLAASLANHTYQTDAGAIESSHIVKAGNVIGLRHSQWFFALDALTGTLLWSQYGWITNTSVPAVYHEGNNSYFVMGNGTDVRMVEPATQTVKWVLTGIGETGYNSLNVKDTFMITNHGTGKSIHYAAYSISSTGRRLLWQEPSWRKEVSMPAAIDASGRAYLAVKGRNKLLKVDMSTGDSLANASYGYRGSSGYAHILGNYLFMENDWAHPSATVIVVFDISGDSVFQKGALRPDAIPFTNGYNSTMFHPIDSGVMYMRGADAVYAVDISVKPIVLGKVDFQPGDTIEVTIGNTVQISYQLKDTFDVVLNEPSAQVTLTPLDGGTINTSMYSPAQPFRYERVVATATWNGTTVHDTLYLKVKGIDQLACATFTQVHKNHPDFVIPCTPSSGTRLYMDDRSGPLRVIGDTIIRTLGVTGFASFEIWTLDSEWTEGARQLYDLQVVDDPNATVPNAPTSLRTTSPGPDFTFYPNPSNGQVRIDSKTDMEISILSYDGREILHAHHQAGSKETLELSALPKGFYIIKATSKGQSTSKPLILL